MRSSLKKQRAVCGTVALVAVLALPDATSHAQAVPARHVHDLSLLVAPTHPCVWPVGMTQHLVTPSRTFGPGAYHRDLIVIDEHTGTQWDAPAHFVPPPDSGLPGAGPMGLLTGEKVPAWQFVGEACVIDLREYTDRAANGHSFLITPDHVKAWEKKHRAVGPGDVVLFHSGYSDRYYRPLATGGERFVHTVLRKETPAWPAPTPECMEYLASRKVMALGLDSPSMGPVPDLAAATHQAGGKHGMIWTECAANLGSLPPTGGFYALLAARHAGGSGSEARAIGITEPRLAARLIASARAKKVVDLSVVLDENYPITWPGHAPGEEASRYVATTLNAFSKARGPYFARSHLLDAQAGTHVVPPSFALPPRGFDHNRYAPAIREVLKEYEAKFGPRGNSEMTTEKVPLEALMGEAHVIDVRNLLGTTAKEKWPASPVITLERVKEHEQKVRPIKAGEVVIFHSGYSDSHFKPLPSLPEIDRMMAAPLAGQAEGWPAPAPEVIVYLAERGVRCIGTDGPTLGGVDRRQALLVYWAAGSRGVFPVEYLINAGKLPQKGAFFLFAPVKIQGSHGGYGRALGLY
jgi:kynurenine formamidase